LAHYIRDDEFVDPNINIEMLRASGSMFTNDSEYNDQLLKQNLEDIRKGKYDNYELVGKVVADTLVKVIDSYINNRVPLLDNMDEDSVNITAEIIGDVTKKDPITGEDIITKNIRNMFKYPLMINAYGGGINSINANIRKELLMGLNSKLAESVRILNRGTEYYPQDMLDSAQETKDKLIDLYVRLNKVNQRGDNPTETFKLSKTLGDEQIKDEIDFYKEGEGNTVIGQHIRNILSNSVSKALDAQLHDFILLRSVANNASSLSGQVVKQVFDHLLAEAVKWKRVTYLLQES